MKDRTFKILIIWESPIALLFVTIINYPNQYLLPMWIALPFGMIFSYLFYIKGIEDGLLFRKPFKVR